MPPEECSLDPTPFKEVLSQPHESYMFIFPLRQYWRCSTVTARTVGVSTTGRVGESSPVFCQRDYWGVGKESSRVQVCMGGGVFAPVMSNVSCKAGPRS